MSNFAGITPSPCCARADTAAAAAATPRPSTSVTKAFHARLMRRSTSPTPMAEIGRRSGLIAIAPMMRITLYSTTP
jgi:hypothetical protein